ncbi:phosphosulfolactate synthase [Chengkuizengella axinellae]|uniref:Phosphosulfolactate synthase n=1 Tax=Chengkuizengella axinellae TaxID=3064388 RepID=A0ABT9J235_9BACL|nr:phosphosulfolactate synthase [Chengkuizengella sp. 2205SS18-9]MDP5275676.1 phosphosulfolactate synthase [Chengkuizengella sp. 2205SS18-9]
MRIVSDLDWEKKLMDPIGERTLKPRKTGITMVIDKGMGLLAFEDFLNTASEYIDIIKLGFGTSPLYPKDVLEKKIGLAKKHQITITPGGTFMEVAVSQNCVNSYFKMIKSLGFNGVEVSDGTIDLSRQFRDDLIKYGTEEGFMVVTEHGKKRKGTKINFNELTHTVHSDIEKGASLVTIEGRESGVEVGIFDENGKCSTDDIVQIMNSVTDPDKILWEAPLKSQQILFINSLGPRANLGNISPEEVFALESIRRGLRSDTFHLAHK